MKMKNVVMTMVLGALMACLVPVANAQTYQNPQAQQTWRSTGQMQGSGSNYSPQVTSVGATSAFSEASTTEDTYKPNGHIRRGSIETNEDMEDNDLSSPIGDAVVPLLLFSLAFGGVICLRKRRAANC